MKLKSLLLGTSLSLIPNLTYAQCSPAQSCAELGYKEITYVPYANWGNRGAGEMYTWLRRFC